MTNSSSGTPSFMYEDDYLELLWDNGPVVTQVQPNRNSNSSSTPNSSNTDEARAKDGRDTNTPKTARVESFESLLNVFSLSDPCDNLGLDTQDVDMVPWVNSPNGNYTRRNNPTLVSKPNDFCSELFLAEFTGANSHPIFAPSDTLQTRMSNTFDRKGKGLHGDYAIKTSADGCTQLYNLAQNCQISSPRANFGAGGLPGAACHSQQGLHEARLLNQDPTSSSKDLMNFPHFSRPVALAKERIQNVLELRSSGIASTSNDSYNGPEFLAPSGSSGTNLNIRLSGNTSKELASVQRSVAGLRLGVSEVEMAGGQVVESHSAASGDKAERAVPSEMEGGAKKKLKTGEGPGDQTEDNERSAAAARQTSSAAAARQTSSAAAARQTSSAAAARQTSSAAAARQTSSAAAARQTSSAAAARQTSSAAAARQTSSAAAARQTSSAAAARQTTSAAAARQTTSAAAARQTTSAAAARQTSARRTRATEVHNLSERRRRDRINARMRTLRELIPNCTKVDKASLLDEAIEHFKSLKLQIQMLLTGNVAMPPAGMENMGMPPNAQLPQMGPGMAIGYGVEVPNMNGPNGGTNDPVPPMLGPQYLPGVLGLPAPPVAPPTMPVLGVPGTALVMTDDEMEAENNPPQAPVISPSSSMELADQNMKLGMIMQNADTNGVQELGESGGKAIN